MNSEMKNKLKEYALRPFETEQFKQYFSDMWDQIPEYIFEMPASTSGKYHNKTQCQKYGLLFHMFMFASIVEHRLRLDWNREFIGPTAIERDMIRCIPFFHDALRCGWNGGEHTMIEHPLLAAGWVRNSKVEHDIPQDYKDDMAEMCERHSGQWNTNKQGVAIMAKPELDREIFIHECDILSSRADIDWIIPKELQEILMINSNLVTTALVAGATEKGEKETIKAAASVLSLIRG